MKSFREDLKRSLVLCLVFMLVVSGIDMSVFADDNTSQPRIASVIKVATTFYENAFPNKEVLNEGWGIRTNYSVTIPLDLSECNNIADYKQDNVDSMILRSETDSIEVSMSNSNCKIPKYNQYSGYSSNNGYARYTSYISRGYYTLSGFNDMLVSLFEQYAQTQGIDLSKSFRDMSEEEVQALHTSYKELALDWLNSNREFTLTINFKNGSILSTEVFVYNLDYIESSGTGGTSISDIVNQGAVFDSDDYDIYGKSFGTTGHAVISVPTSKTVKDKDFYKDDNAIFYRKDGEYLDTYYVDVNSDKNISIPFDEISKDLDITQVKIGDNKVYDTYESIQLNGGNDIVSEDYDKGYTITKTDKLQSVGDTVYNFGTVNDDNYIDVLKNVFGNEAVIKYNNKDINVASCGGISLSDLYKSGEIYYAKSNGGLLGSDKYNGEDDTEYENLYEGNYTIDNHDITKVEKNQYCASIVLKNREVFGGSSYLGADNVKGDILSNDVKSLLPQYTNTLPTNLAILYHYKDFYDSALGSIGGFALGYYLKPKTLFGDYMNITRIERPLKPVNFYSLGKLDEKYKDLYKETHVYSLVNRDNLEESNNSTLIKVIYNSNFLQELKKKVSDLSTDIPSDVYSIVNNYPYKYVFNSGNTGISYTMLDNNRVITSDNVDYSFYRTVNKYNGYWYLSIPSDWNDWLIDTINSCYSENFTCIDDIHNSEFGVETYKITLDDVSAEEFLCSFDNCSNNRSYDRGFFSVISTGDSSCEVYFPRVLLSGEESEFGSFIDTYSYYACDGLDSESIEKYLSNVYLYELKDFNTNRYNIHVDYDANEILKISSNDECEDYYNSLVSLDDLNIPDTSKYGFADPMYYGYRYYSSNRDIVSSMFKYYNNYSSPKPTEVDTAASNEYVWSHYDYYFNDGDSYLDGDDSALNFGTVFEHWSRHYGSFSNYSPYGIDTFDVVSNKNTTDISKFKIIVEDIVKNLEAQDVEIDYEKSSMPDFKSGTAKISDYLDVDVYNVPKLLMIKSNTDEQGRHESWTTKTVTGVEATDVDSISTNNKKKVNNISVVSLGGITIPMSNISVSGNTGTMRIRSLGSQAQYTKGISYPILMQVHGSDADYVKNALEVNRATLQGVTSSNKYDVEDSLIDNTDVLGSSGPSSSYYDYKFGNIVFASRPSEVRNLKIDNSGVVSWKKSLDEGLGVNSNGTSVSDDVISLKSYTLYVTDESDNRLYKATIDYDESTSEFTLPKKYNVAGNTITVYATNRLGDSDEVSVTIDTVATPSPTPTSNPSNPNPPIIVVTPTPTVEPTTEPTIEPTATPVPEYKLTVEDVYYNEDGTKEKSEERLTTTVKEGEQYSYSSLDKDGYIVRVPKFEGTVTSDVKLVFEYDKKKSNDLVVQGYVNKSDGTPVDNSLVEIVDEESKSDITDNTGFYRIEGVSEGEHDYTLYSGTTTGSSVIATCKISVKDNNGKVEVTFNSDDSKIDTQTETGVIRIDATLFDEEVTPSPVPTEVPTPEPTIEPTMIPTVEPTPVVTTTPAVTVSPEITTKPTVEPPSDMPTPLEPDEVETPKPTKKPIKSTHKVVGIPIYTPEPDNEVKEERVTLVQTGLYDNTKSIIGLILTSIGVCILFISLKKRNKK